MPHHLTTRRGRRFPSGNLAPWHGVALLLVGLLQAAAAAQAVRVEPVVVEHTPAIAGGYLRVRVQLWEPGGAVLEGEADALDAYRQMGGLEDLDAMLDQQAKPARSFGAFLDTGASGCVLSRSTAQRFGVRLEPGAVYHEAGLHGETPMGLSEPYDAALSGGADGFRMALKDVRFQVSLAEANPLVEMAYGGINVIGMPAIRRLMVEIDPAPGAGPAAPDAAAALEEMDLADPESIDRLLSVVGDAGGPAVILHGPDHQPGPIDLVVPLRYVNFSRRQNPKDRGPLPALADNPTVPGIRTQLGGEQHDADWLLDTGAPACIISTRHAAALGLIDADGRFQQQPVSYLPLGGISGRSTNVPGFRLDRLRLPTGDGRGIEYRDVIVFVHDISTTLDDGRTVTLDGVLGLNLFTPGLGDLMGALGGGIAVAPPPFERVWIDGPGERLLLDLPEE